ncbi:MAG: hypothetical protein M3R64_09010 [Pseudomonadota bacterium]|nr:hypothetical protein [Pseudomonadota bacterium]
MKRWHGIGYKFGYDERTEKDGSWRIDAAVHGRGSAIDIAMYRAAERARDEGYGYVVFLGGKGSKSPGIDSATIYARPSHNATSPIGCRSKNVTSCYTADVAEVLRRLGGPGGSQPGVAVVDHRDQFGRQVFLSGYGIGRVAPLSPGALPRSRVMTVVDGRPGVSAAAVKPVAPTSNSTSATLARQMVAARTTASSATAALAFGRATVTASDRFEQALKANQPIRGRNPKQGWTIGD